MNLNSDKEKFLYSLYLECICDNTRNKIIVDSNRKGYITENSLEEFVKIFEANTYDTVLYKLSIVSKSKMIIMFQVRKGAKITGETKWSQINVLSSPEERKYPILNSELLNFYINSSNQEKFNGKLLFDIKDSVRLVSVNSVQSDKVVGTYKREDCKIAYVQLEYKDEVNNKNTNYIYFALFFDNDAKTNEIMKSLQNFLSFKHYLLDRIKHDFRANLFGRNKEEEWKNEWLAMEKAGAHADNSTINSIIKDIGFSGETIQKALMTDKCSNAEEIEPKNMVLLTSNILIAKYFRAIFGIENESFYSLDNVVKSGNNKYCNLDDIIRISDSLKNGEQNELNNPKGFKLVFKNNGFNEYSLYGKYGKKIGSSESIGGMPLSCNHKTTYRKRYLQAFIVDIINNALKYGNELEISIEKTKDDEPNYLVFKNNIKDNTTNKNYLERNYKLKASIEFDNPNGKLLTEGISLGCINHFMSYYTNMETYYEPNNINLFYCIKLPIIQ